jgi:hypothetical protein
MSIKGSNLKSMIKDVGMGNFRSHLRKLLGVKTKQYPSGVFPCKYDASEAQIGVDEFSIREISESFLGQQFVDGIHDVKTAESTMLELAEAINPVTPSTFSNINAWTSVMGGLIEQRILAGYNMPDLIGRDLVEVVPTRVNSQRIITIPNITFPKRPTYAGEEIPSVGMNSRWILRQELIKYAQKLALTKEAVVFDLTGELLSQAESLGRTLALAQEMYIAASVQGVNISATATITPDSVNGFTANTYAYNANVGDAFNNTFQTSAGSGTTAKYNYVNQSTGKTGITSWTDMQFIRGQLSLSTEYETGFRINASLDEVLVSPFNFDQAQYVVHNTQVFNMSSGFPTSGNAPGTFSPNSPLNASVQVKKSANWEQVLVSSGVSQANAQCYVTAGNFKKSHAFYEAWPMLIEQGNPTSSEMISTQTVNLWVASWYGVPVVKDPRYVYQFTN